MGVWGRYTYPTEPPEDESYWLERGANEESLEEFILREMSYADSQSSSLSS